MASPSRQNAGPTPRAAEAGRPLSFVFLELTHRCNLRCRHCYNSSSPCQTARSLPTERWLSLLNEISDAGATKVQFTGGEPTTHPDLFTLIEHARDRCLSVELFTNATLFREEDLDRLAKLEVDVATSLHSHLPDVHDSITGMPGSHVATVKAIEGLIARQLEVRVVAVLLAENADHGGEVARLVRGLGVLAPTKIDHVRPTGRGAKAAEPSSELSHCGGAIADATGLLHAGEGTPPTCWDGKLAISPEGLVMPCIFARTLSLGCVGDTALGSVLATDELQRLWSLTTDDVEDCAGCDRKNTCLDCRALALSVHGDILAKSPRCGYRPPPPRPSRSLADRFAARPGLVVSRLEDEFLILDPEAARLHRLNVAAAMVLDALAAGALRETVKAQLAQAFEIPLEDAAEDVDTLIDELVAAKIIEPGSISTEDRAIEDTPPRVPATDLVALEGSSGFPPSTNLHGSLFDCAGIPAHIRASEEITKRLVDFFAQVVSGPEPADELALPPDQRITIVSRSPGGAAGTLHHVFRGDRRVRLTNQSDELLCEVENLLCTIAAEKSAGGDDASLCLHAAALAGPRGALLLPGAHGAGKSTFAAWAHAAGLTYLGDELIRVRRDRGSGHRVRGLPKPIKLKPEGLRLVPEALSHLLFRGSDGQGWLAVEGDRGEHPLAAIVVPRRQGGPPALLPLEPGEVVEALLSQTFNLRSLGPRRSLDAACALANEIPGFVLDTTELASSAAAAGALASRSS